MAHEKLITGAVGFGGRVYRAGEEEQFNEALKSDLGKTVDLDALEASGHLSGYGSAKARAQAEEAAAAQAAATTDAAPSAATERPAKAAGKRGKR